MAGSGQGSVVAARRAAASPRLVAVVPRVPVLLRDEAVNSDPQSFILAKLRRSSTRLRERGVAGASGSSDALATALARPVDLLRFCLLLDAWRFPISACLPLPTDTLREEAKDLVSLDSRERVFEGMGVMPFAADDCAANVATSAPLQPGVFCTLSIDFSKLVMAS